MKRNIASQVVSAVVVSATDGSAVTASVAVTVTGDNGTQGAGGGTLAHKGGGEWSYVPTQAETNFDHIMFKFSATGAVPVGVQVYTRASTVDVNVIQISGDGPAADALESYLDGTEFMPVDAHKQNFSVSGDQLTTKKPDGTTDTAYSPKTVTTDPTAEPITGAS